MTSKKLKLTPIEIAALRNVGWNETIDIPNDAVDVFLDDMQKEIQKFKNEHPEIGELTFEQKHNLCKEYVNRVKNKIAQAKAAIPSDINLENYSPSVAQALTMALNAVQNQQKNDNNKEENTSSDKDSSSQTEEKEKPVEPVICPHCHLRLDMPALDEPSNLQKLTFLQCILGQTAFMQDIPIYNGSIVLTFRTLTPKELDTAFMQVSYDVLNQKIFNNYGDIYEQLNRYRTYLQLVRIKNNIGANQDFIELPDGLSPKTNRIANRYWELSKPLGPNETELVQIEEYMLNNVLRTEFIFRIVNNACNQFNRLVAKLEATMNSENFWKITAPPS